MFLIDGVNYITAGLVQYTDANGSPFSNCSVDVYFNDEKESTFTTDSNGYGTASIVAGKSYTFRFKNSSGKIAYVLSPVMLGVFASGGDVEAERERAEAAEASLQTQINGKASQSALEAETSARESADTQLQSNIEAETARAQDAESALDARIDGVEDDVEAIDNRLTTAESDIDSLESSVDALYNTEVQGTDGETSVSSSTSGKVKTFVVGLASAIKTKIEAAYSHISDAVKHITATERTNWNTAYNHSQTEGNPHGTEIEEIDGLRTELTTIESDVAAIEGVIPSEATTSNKLADKSFVNSSIASQTAYFRGTFDIVTDLGLTHGASNTAIATALASVVSVVTPNDYTFVIDEDTAGNTLYKRFKYSGSVWQYEYTLNNSSFTAAQWAAIQSGITAEDVADIGYNTTARHTHANKNLLDTYTQSDASLADAVAKKHEHANKTILDNTTASYTSEEKTKLEGIESGAEANVNADWNATSGDAQILNKPSTFPPSSHTHSIANVTGLQDELNIRKHDTYTIAEFNALTKTYRECTVKLNNAQGAVKKAILLCDATSWWGKSTGSNGFSFRGNLIYTQVGSNNNDGYIDLSILVTSYGVKDLMSNNAKLRPVILKYTEGSAVSYYVALLVTSIDCIVSCNDTRMTGYWWTTSNLLGTALKGDASYSLPEGWEVFRDDNIRYGQSLTAQKLETARTIQTNLGSTAAASFDGSANVTPGVTGTLPIANGGTGATAAKAAQYNLLNNMSLEDTDPSDNTLIVGAYSAGATTSTGFVYKRPFIRVWNYIKGKISSVLGLTATNYSGKAATAGTADKATADASGNNIANTYATKSEIPDVSGKEDASNKVTTLDNSTTHYPSTSAVTTALNGKQDTISDIATIRSNATNGQTAYGWGNHADAGYATSVQMWENDEALQRYCETLDSNKANKDGSNVDGFYTLGGIRANNNYSNIDVSVGVRASGSSGEKNSLALENNRGSQRGIYLGRDSSDTTSATGWMIREEGGKVYLPKCSAGSTTQPVYVNSSGLVTACNGNAVKSSAYTWEAGTKDLFLQGNGGSITITIPIGNLSEGVLYGIHTARTGASETTITMKFTGSGTIYGGGFNGSSLSSSPQTSVTSSAPHFIKVGTTIYLCMY